MFETEKLIKLFNENKAEILTGVGIVSLVSGSVMFFQAGIRVGPILKELKDKKTSGSLTKEDSKRLHKELLKNLWLPITMDIIGIAGIVSSDIIQNKQITTLAAACAINEAEIATLKKDLKDRIKDDNEAEIATLKKDLKDRIKDDNEADCIFEDMLCLDVYSGRYFRSNIRKIEEAITDLSIRVKNTAVSLNEFYSLLRIPGSEMGCEYGWTKDDLTCDGRLDILIDGGLTPQGELCLTIDYIVHKLD